MNSKLHDLLDILSGKTSYRKRYIRYSDPSKGIEYNGINPNWRVCKKIWKVDVARSPQVIRWDAGINMHGKAYDANRLNAMVNYCASRVKGR